MSGEQGPCYRCECFKKVLACCWYVSISMLLLEIFYFWVETLWIQKLVMKSQRPDLNVNQIVLDDQILLSSVSATQMHVWYRRQTYWFSSVSRARDTYFPKHEQCILRDPSTLRAIQRHQSLHCWVFEAIYRKHRCVHVGWKVRKRLLSSIGFSHRTT